MKWFDSILKKRNKANATSYIKPPDALTEPPIPGSEMHFYRPAEYYANVVHPGTQFEQRVLTFEDLKKISFPSSRGLYVSEILLLYYCSLGSYPNPKSGYPGFWWFSYGIRNVGYRLSTLESRGFIIMDSQKGKYKLTALGEKELAENIYVPYMHKAKDTTINGKFGPEFNVWVVNRRLHDEHTNDWESIVADIRRQIESARSENSHKREQLLREEEKQHPEWTSEMRRLEEKFKEEEYATQRYNETGDMLSFILFWENREKTYGLKTNEYYKLANLYLEANRFEDAMNAIQRIKKPDSPERIQFYIDKIHRARAKEERRKAKESTK